MKRTEESFDRLIAELRSDMVDLETVERRNKQAMARMAAGARDELDWMTLGYTIHNIYGIFENYCVRVAKFFENDLGEASWHRELIQRMRLDIEGVRPALATFRGCHDHFVDKLLRIKKILGASGLTIIT